MNNKNQFEYIFPYKIKYNFKNKLNQNRLVFKFSDQFYRKNKFYISHTPIALH